MKSNVNLKHTLFLSSARMGVCTMLLGFACLAPAFANDDELERDNLARIAGELERIQIMVKEAAQRAPTSQRVKFRYEWLLRDLELLRDGVVTHIDAPRQPRPVPALRGDYRQ